MAADRPAQTLASPLYPAAAGDPDRLFELLPADLRRRDLLGDRALQALLRVLGAQYDLLEADIVSLSDDLSVETCRADLLPYIGDLLAFQLPRTAPGVESGSAADEAREARQASLIRRLLGDLVGSRRRKGSLAEARRLVREFGGGSSYLVETASRIDRTAAVRRPPGLGLARGDFGPSLRGREGPGQPGGPYDRAPIAADVRRVRNAADVTPGRAGPDGLEVHLGRLASHEIADADAFAVIYNDDPYLYLGTFDPLGASIPLLARGLDDPGPGESTDESHFIAPIRRRAMAVRPLDYYGPGKAISVSVDGAAVGPGEVLVADLPDADEPGGALAHRWDVPRDALETGRLLIDPERGRLAFRLTDSEAARAQSTTGRPRQPHHRRHGRVQPPEADPITAHEDVRLRVTYQTGLVADLGGGGYDRALRDVSPGESYIRVDPNLVGPDPDPSAPPPANRQWTVGTFEAALALYKSPAIHPPGSRVIIELLGSGTHRWDLIQHDHGGLAIPAGSRLTIRAESGAWPLIWDGRPGPNDTEQLKFVGLGPGARLVLDGLRIAGRALDLEDDLRAVIRDTTLVPGWMPPGTSEHYPWAPSLSLHGVRTGVVIDRSVLGRIQVLPKLLDDPTPIVIRDSIVGAAEPHHFALAAAEDHKSVRPGRPARNYAYAALVLRRATVLGRVAVHQVVLAVDSLLTERLDASRRQTGCVRFCVLPTDSATPPRYRCQPDLALRRAEAGLAVGEPAGLDPSAPDSLAKLAAIDAKLAPRLASRRYGDPAFGALAAGVADEVRTAAEDGGEPGAFHDLDLPARDQELIDRLSESVPAGVDVRLIVHPRTVS